MNRTTVVFLALAILLAHTLAIHQTPPSPDRDPGGDFAAPYERAHVAYRLGRNLAYDGRALWDPHGPWIESYPSPIWIGLGALAARLGIYPTTLSQALGILFALSTVIVVAQFSSNRLAGLIAPVLIATSGSACASAASGTEAPLAMLLVSLTFLAFERGWRKTFAVGLIALLLTLPEGLALLFGFLLLERLDRPRGPEGLPRPALVKPLLAAFVAVAFFAGLRLLFTGKLLSPFASELVSYDPTRWKLGLQYVWSFLSSSGSGSLLALPLAFSFSRTLPPIGRRATLLFLAWAAVVALAGGDHQPFWNVLAPALPLLFVSIQSAITAWIDRSPRQASLAWALLSLTMVACLFVSKLPGDLGPLPLERTLRSWMEPPTALFEAFEQPLGRRGLLAEIREVEQLRSVGIFLRDQVSADATIGTFWPGAIGYLSRKQVVDLLGRTQPLAGQDRPRTWRAAARVDLVRALSLEADYLVLETGAGGRTRLSELLHHWLKRYDAIGDNPERLRELTEALQHYELVAVPVPARSSRPEQSSPNPFLLLRNKRLGLAPELELRCQPSSFEVLARHRGHEQVVDLMLELIDSQGQTWNMRPTGEWVAASEIDARTNLLLYDTGPNSVLLVRGTLPPAGVSLFARLHTPGISADSPLATAGTSSVSLEQN